MMTYATRIRWGSGCGNLNREMVMIRLVQLGVVVLCGCIAIPGTAAATVQSPAKPSKQQHDNKKVAAELHAAKALLEKANHDYHGHRAKAVHEITHAIHLLEHGKHPAKTTSSTAGEQSTAQTKPKSAGPKKSKAKNHKGKHKPQSASDAQLKQAIDMLQAAHKNMSTGKQKHHDKAAELIQKAIHELHAALKVA